MKGTCRRSVCRGALAGGALDGVALAGGALASGILAGRALAGGMLARGVLAGEYLPEVYLSEEYLSEDFLSDNLSLEPLLNEPYTANQNISYWGSYGRRSKCCKLKPQVLCKNINTIMCSVSEYGEQFEIQHVKFVTFKYILFSTPFRKQMKQSTYETMFLCCLCYDVIFSCKLLRV